MPGFDKQLIQNHEEAAEKAFTLLFIAGVFSGVALFRGRKKNIPQWSYSVVFVLLLISCVSLGWTASLGGRIRHPEMMLKPG